MKNNELAPICLAVQKLVFEYYSNNSINPLSVNLEALVAPLSEHNQRQVLQYAVIALNELNEDETKCIFTEFGEIQDGSPINEVVEAISNAAQLSRLNHIMVEFGINDELSKEAFEVLSNPDEDMLTTDVKKEFLATLIESLQARHDSL